MSINPEEIEKMRKELDVLVKGYVMAAATVLEAADRNMNKMRAFENIELSHRSNDDTSSPISVFLATIASPEGRDALDLWRIAERDFMRAKINSNLKWLEVDAYLTYMKLKAGVGLE